MKNGWLWISLGSLIFLPFVDSCSLSVAKCAGEQTLCGYLSSSNCAKATECHLAPGCSDLGASGCDILFDQKQCTDTSQACYWQNGVCLGPCDNQTQDACVSLPGCMWTACTGQVKPCSEYGHSDCPTWNGCYLEGFS